MRELYNSRFLTTRQLTALCFDGKREAAKKRIQKLKRAGFIEARNVAFGTVPFHVVSNAGQAWLLKHLGIQKQGRFRISPATLAHELALRDWLVRVRVECASLQVKCEYSLSPVPLRLSRFTQEQVRPDAQLTLVRNGISTSVFVELDTGSQSHRVLLRKIEAYFRVAKIEPAPRLVFVFTRPNRMRRVIEKHRAIIDRAGCLMLTAEQGKIVELLLSRGVWLGRRDER